MSGIFDSRFWRNFWIIVAIVFAIAAIAATKGEHECGKYGDRQLKDVPAKCQDYFKD